MAYPSMRARLEANSIPVPMCGCRIWTGAVRRNSAGLLYGKINVRSRRRYREPWHERCGQRRVKSLAAHRVSLAEHLGVRVYQLNQVAHACGLTLCIEPRHLRSTTRKQNEADKKRVRA